MSNIDISITAFQALQFHNVTVQFSGPYFDARETFRARVKKVWPEIVGGKAEFTSEDKRGISITPEEKTAICEGALAYCLKPEIKDIDKHAARDLVKAIRFSGWLNKKLAEHGPKSPLSDMDSDDAPEPDAELPATA